MTNNLTYEKIKGIVTENPEITAQGFYGKLRQEGRTDKEILDSLENAIRSEGPSITDDRSIFLKAIALLVKSGIKINIRDTASNTLLYHAAMTKQADVIEVLLGGDKFNEEEKLSALNGAIGKDNIREVSILLNSISHENKLKILSQTIRDKQLSEVIRSQRASVVKMLLDKGEFNKKEKIDALNNASIDGRLSS